MNFKSVFILLVISVIYVHGVTVQEEVKNSTTFTLDFYRSSFDGSKNMVISPISFRILLSIMYHSTSGDTELELKHQVYFSDDKHETALSQLQTLDPLIASSNVKIVNRVYVKKGQQLKQSFLDKAVQYHSGIEQKDFSKSQKTANEINHFVEQQTNSLIKDLISPNALNANTALLLLNTLYFKANWQNQFKADLSEKVFHAIDGRDYRINFMISGGRTYQFLDSPELKALTLELPYIGGSNAKFWVFLPHVDSSIGELKDKLNANVIQDIKANFISTYNRIHIPAFDIESEIDGIQELRKLGLNSMFDKAEISVLEGAPNLKVSDAKQKVKIIVNTNGTEAAAATYFGSSHSSASVYSKPPLVFDRPFIYMILTADTTEPLFVGHFSKPSQIG